MKTARDNECQLELVTEKFGGKTLEEIESIMAKRAPGYYRIQNWDAYTLMWLNSRDGSSTVKAINTAMEVIHDLIAKIRQMSRAQDESNKTLLEISHLRDEVEALKKASRK